jgi:hypothetical protein
MLLIVSLKLAPIPLPLSDKQQFVFIRTVLWVGLMLHVQGYLTTHIKLTPCSLTEYDEC